LLAVALGFCLLAAKRIGYECLKAEEKFSFMKKPYLLVYLALPILSGTPQDKNKLTAGKDRLFF
jgi:hypothetical protein